MAKRGKGALVGIEFGTAEVRVVETRWTGVKPIILAAGAASLPKGAIVNGVIVQATQVAAILRQLLDSSGVASKRAVFGIPSAACISRSFTMPPVPPEELGLLVDGEIRHYQVLRTSGGVYGFFKVVNPNEDLAESTIVVSAAEEDATSSLREVSSKAGLEIAGLEPAWLAGFRGSQFNQSDPETIVWLGILEASTELVVARQGTPLLYRHIDVGTASLFANAESFIDDPASSTVSDVDLPNGITAKVRKGPADTIALEIKRVLDFVEREFATVATPSRIVVVSNDPKVSALSSIIEGSQPLSVSIGVPDGAATSDGSVLKAIGGLESSKFVPALGLSIYRSDQLPATIPSMDLSTVERATVAKEFERRQLTGTLAASILLVVAGIVGSFSLGLRANSIGHVVAGKKDALKSLEARARQYLAVELSQTEQIAKYKANSIDLIPLMDLLSSSLNPGTGYEKVTISKENGVTVTGESQSEPAMLGVVDSLQSHNFLSTISIVNYQLIDEDRSSPAVRFQLAIKPIGYGATKGVAQ